MTTYARKPRTPKSTTELKALLEKKKAELAELEQKAFAGEIKEHIDASGIAELYKNIKKDLKDVGDVALLSEIAKAAGVKRLTITQTPVAKRKTKVV
jgi:ribosomal protein L29